MKVLVACFPYAGHFNPTLPIVTELIRRGHEVVWLSGPEYAPKITRTGARFAPMSPGALMDETKEPKQASKLPSLSFLLALLKWLYLDRIVAQVEDYRRVLDIPDDPFKPDVMLVDFCTYGAHCLRDLTEIPYATLGINPLVVQDALCPPFGTGELPPKTFLGRWWNSTRHAIGDMFLFPKLDAALNEERKKLGLEPLGTGGFINAQRSPLLHIMMTTEMFEFPRQMEMKQLRWVGPLIPAVDDDWDKPEWWNEILRHERKKVVHVTQGTVATEGNKLIMPTIQGLARHEDLLVVVTGKGLDDIFIEESHSNASGNDGSKSDLATRIPRPANVRTAPFLPHPAFLPYVGVMVTNAGYNGVLTALSCGVPLVCAGRTEDKADVSSRVAHTGCGIDLATGTPTPSAVATAVMRIVTEGTFREAASRIAQDFAKHDGPKEAVDELEKIARTN